MSITINHVPSKAHLAFFATISKVFSNFVVVVAATAANFIYFKEPFAGFPDALEKNGVLIRPRTGGYARVTIGTYVQMQKLTQIVNQLTQ